jgi:aryl-alcohol dehydrogenase-like predicted oxidoreductase
LPFSRGRESWGHRRLSTHNRKLAGRLAADRAVDGLMIRYNAAHRGAESEIFPHVFGRGTGILAYTATRWTKLLRPLRSLSAPPLSAGDCYRFVLSHPVVDACLTAPSKLKELEENTAAVRLGPLDEASLARVREFGDAVHGRKE